MDEDRVVVGHLSYADQTTIHPLGLALVLVCGFAMLALPRRYAVWPIAIMACLVAPAQRLVVAGLDFNLLRIMVLFAWLRIFARNENLGFCWRRLDSVLLAWAVVSVATYTALTGSFSAFVNRLGLAFDAVGMYFAFRCLIRTWDDLDSLVQGFILVSLPVALAFLVERSTAHNFFAFFGGVPAVTAIRDGRLRCQGAFAHPILAGCFWAALVPLFAARYWKGGSAWQWGLVGLATSSLVVFACASSTPVMAVLLSFVGAAFFRLRRHMRAVRWTLVGVLCALSLVMQAPVYHLIARVDIISGSTGWHRYNIIHQAIAHLDEWWLMGAAQIDHWNIWANDITNQYVTEGIMGGVAKLGLFIAAIVLAFAGVGRLWRGVEHDRYLLAVAWALGVSLFVHVMNFWAVTYCGQITIEWYLSLALTASLAPARPPSRPHNRRAGSVSSHVVRGYACGRPAAMIQPPLAPVISPHRDE